MSWLAPSTTAQGLRWLPEAPTLSKGESVDLLMVSGLCVAQYKCRRYLHSFETCIGYLKLQYIQTGESDDVLLVTGVYVAQYKSVRYLNIPVLYTK